MCLQGPALGPSLAPFADTPVRATLASSRLSSWGSELASFSTAGRSPPQPQMAVSAYVHDGACHNVLAEHLRNALLHHQ